MSDAKTNREKVVRAVDLCFDYWLDQHKYLDPLELEKVRQRKADALFLLKEQEAKIVIKIAKRFNDCDLTGYCPFCSRPLIKDWAENYCGYCGKPVLWEGR